MGEVKTLGYLLKHYNDSQCYEQFISVRWLEEKIKHLHQWDEVKPEYYDAIKDVLDILNGEREGRP